MAGTQFIYSESGLDETLAVLATLSDWDKGTALSGIGGLIENQARERIEVTKTAPDGEPWEAWSPEYAAQAAGKSKRRRAFSNAKPSLFGGASLLFRSGALGDSLAWQIESEDSLIVGTDLVYGAVHQFGSRDYDGEAGTPPRPYLGISFEDAEAITDFVVGVAGAGLK